MSHIGLRNLVKCYFERDDCLSRNFMSQVEIFLFILGREF